MKDAVISISVKILCLLIIWTSLTIYDIIPDNVKWQPAVMLGNSISYVTSGQRKQDRFAKNAENVEFSKNSYTKYVNIGLDANLAASGIAAAYARGKRLYILDEGIFYYVQPSKNPADTYLMDDVEISSPMASFIMSSKSILGIDESGEGISVYRIPNQLEHAFLRDEGGVSLNDMSFTEISSLTYTILSRQETGKISVQEMAVLMYCTQEGILLGWQGGTAWLADDKTNPDIVTVYTMSSDGSLEEKLHYSNTYAGTGTGRFIANDALFYADADMLYFYYLDGSESFYVPPEVYGSPAEALNYTYNSETGTYWIGYINGDTIYCLDYEGNNLRKATLGYVQDGKAVTGLFSINGYFYVTYEDGTRHFSYHYPRLQ
ncbi:MAG: hypothetical protein LUE87_08895 [Lachnospiraceae bacterium]|nr:hypothetical protein [Lachnospiraceae bacterium]